MKSLGASETAFVQTCAKYYKPNFIARLQYIMKTSEYSLQDSFGETLKALKTQNVIPKSDLESFGFQTAPKAVPKAEKPIVQKPVQKPVKKAKTKKKK